MDEVYHLVYQRRDQFPSRPSAKKNVPAALAGEQKVALADYVSRMKEGGQLDDPAGFVKRLNDLMLELAGGKIGETK